MGDVSFAYLWQLLGERSCKREAMSTLNFYIISDGKQCQTEMVHAGFCNSKTIHHTHCSFLFTRVYIEFCWKPTKILKTWVKCEMSETSVDSILVQDISRRWMNDHSTSHTLLKYRTVHQSSQLYFSKQPASTNVPPVPLHTPTALSHGTTVL
jgi:hypothetical protein